MLLNPFSSFYPLFSSVVSRKNMEITFLLAISTFAKLAILVNNLFLSLHFYLFGERAKITRLTGDFSPIIHSILH